MLVEKYSWPIRKSLFAETNQDSPFSYTRENLKLFNITSKFFSFFNNNSDKKKIAKKIQTSSNSSGITGNITLFYFM